MTKEQLFKLRTKCFKEKQIQLDRLILKEIYPLDLIEFICAVEENTGEVIPIEKIRPENFKDLDSIYRIINKTFLDE
ncbi:hypothetical protein [Abyssisolibacter fermentans]|uniref:hypothetical protein n=1 Tax=Abyssisolibacter fermentans TaxID=1766203 RepID=UPI0008322686|nr:hypothetical protein [Abyssisolibacter fermentans]